MGTEDRLARARAKQEQWERLTWFRRVELKVGTRGENRRGFGGIPRHSGTVDSPTARISSIQVVAH